MSEYIVELYEPYDAGYRIGEKIVRCRDCKYRYGCLHLVDNGDGDMRRCDATLDGYCAWGERRGE